MFHSWKNDLLDDAIRTIKRLNEECSDRIRFEQKLIERINDYETILKEYEKRTGIPYDEVYNNIRVKDYSKDIADE